MAIGVLIIGDEILSGKRQDKHFTRAIQILGVRGLELDWAAYLGDDPARITATLQRTFATDDIVFSFGGIGATPDDHTRQCAAAALGRPLVRHPEAVREIEARFGAEAYPRRVMMAEFPEGAAIIPNPFNRIAAFSVGSHHFLPGFPEMAWSMMGWVLDTKYQSLFRESLPHEEAVIVHDAGESDLVDLMNAIVADYPDLKLSSLPSFIPGGGRLIELSVRGEATRAREAMARIRGEVARLGWPMSARAARSSAPTST